MCMRLIVKQYRVPVMMEIDSGDINNAGQQLNGATEFEEVRDNAMRWQAVL